MIVIWLRHERVCRTIKRKRNIKFSCPFEKDMLTSIANLAQIVAQIVGFGKDSYRYGRNTPTLIFEI